MREQKRHRAEHDDVVMVMADLDVRVAGQKREGPLFRFLTHDVEPGSPSSVTSPNRTMRRPVQRSDEPSDRVAQGPGRVLDDPPGGLVSIAGSRFDIGDRRYHAWGEPPSEW